MTPVIQTLYCEKCKQERQIKSSLSTRNGKIIILNCNHMVDERPVNGTPSALEKVEKVEKPKEETTKIDLKTLCANLKEFTCVFCLKPQKITSFLASGNANTVSFRLECGHINSINVSGMLPVAPQEKKPKPSPTPTTPIIPPPVKPTKQRDERWKEFFGYQQVGVEFIENSGFRALIGDEMGLGKTIQAIGALRYNQEILTPALVVCPAGLIYKWQREFKKWYNDKFKSPEDAPMIHLNGLGGLLDGQNIHIISSSLIGKPGVLQAIREYGFKTLIIDESHQFKNDGSNRTDSLLQIAARIPYKILLSGTSILNRTMEYYNSLYLLRPEMWPSKRWLESYCQYSYDGKIVGLADYKKQEFFDRTKAYVLRRKKSEVLKDLPEKLVNYTFINVQDQKGFVKGYNDVLDELEDQLHKTQSEAAMSIEILALMAKLRHAVGLAKVRPLLERLEDWLENTEDEKICIGTHHKLVMEFFQRTLSRWEPICISDESPKTKDERSELFRTSPKHRVMVASILGCGIGRDLQFCPNVLVAEREWNRAIENQFEDRFHRIGMENKVNIDYYMAEHTIDEFFHEMVTLKGAVSEQGLNSQYNISSQTLKELAQCVVQKRLKYVG